MSGLDERQSTDRASELLDALGRLSRIEEEIVSQRALLIAEASHYKVSWERMANASGVSKQSLNKRFNQQAARLVGICTDALPDKARRVVGELHPVVRIKLLAERVKRVPGPRLPEAVMEAEEIKSGGTDRVELL